MRPPAPPIGVQVDVVNTTGAEFGGLRQSGDYDITSAIAGVKADPLLAGLGWGDRNKNFNSAEFDALYERALLAKDSEEAAPLVRQMDMMVVENVWQLWGPLAPAFNVHWPWAKGYGGEGGFGGSQNHPVFARIRIDQELKSAMGF